MKRIAIFCDGTWNTPDKMKNGKKCQTNVVKMADGLLPASDDGTIQMLYYDAGIGSTGRILKRMYDGATGTGISKNILDAYLFLIKNFKPGDELFLFGFSRGAFTVRSLAGLIRNSGILRPENKEQIRRAYDIYRSRLPEFHPRETESILFRKSYSIEENTIIKFIGVWDTVGALGNPLFLNGILSRRNRFHDTNLSSQVKYAYHAISIDEKRKNFKATLWNQTPGNPGQVLEQVWFAGVHSDVGGGYPETGLSDIALKWMKEKAQGCNLEFGSITSNPDTMGKIHESHKGFYRLIPAFHRPIDYFKSNEGPTNETIHPSATERFKNNPEYRPRNLLDYLVKNPD